MGIKFIVQLQCSACGPVTPEFRYCYIPPDDADDVVFQDISDYTFRVATCHDVTLRAGFESPTEFLRTNTPEADGAYEAVMESFEGSEKRPGEARVDVHRAGFDRPFLVCPNCTARSVGVHFVR